jgi:large subunit ribosomal protein L3
MWAIKVRMYRFWDEHGNRIPVTMLWAPNNVVVANRWPAKHGRWGTVVACGWPTKVDPINPIEKAVYTKAGVKYRGVLREFVVTEDAMLPVGFPLTVRHFMPGQCVDITSKSKAKGFQGVMKRGGFAGGPASHGATKFHRRPGSIGAIGRPVQKGKKMPGPMGDNKQTLMSQYIYMIDYKNDLIYVQGSIPGESGQYVLLQDSYYTDFEEDNPPPFPSFLPDPEEDLESKSFDECQLRAKSKYKYHLDYAHPTGGPPIT